MRTGVSSPRVYESCEGGGFLGGIGRRAKKASGDQSLGSDCHGDQRRATLPHDHIEQASRARSSGATTHMASVLYAWGTAAFP